MIITKKTFKNDQCWLTVYHKEFGFVGVFHVKEPRFSAYIHKTEPNELRFGKSAKIARNNYKTRRIPVKSVPRTHMGSSYKDKT